MWEAALQITRDDRRIGADEVDLPWLAVVRVRSEDGVPERVEANITGGHFNFSPSPQSPRWSASCDENASSTDEGQSGTAGCDQEIAPAPRHMYLRGLTPR